MSKKNADRTVPINSKYYIPRDAIITTPEPPKIGEILKAWNEPIPDSFDDLDDRKKQILENVFQGLADGLTIEEATKAAGTCAATFFRMRKRYPHLAELCEGVRVLNIERVEDALLRSALGYDYETTKTVNRTQVVDGEQVGPTEVTVTQEEHKIAPNTTAAIFFLKNRAREKWKSDKHITIEEKKDEGDGSIIDVTERNGKAKAFLDTLSPATRKELVRNLISDDSNE